jgi:phage shock protein PspC (stress-responsive transcriptional regulator)
VADQRSEAGIEMVCNLHLDPLRVIPETAQGDHVWRRRRPSLTISAVIDPRRPPGSPPQLSRADRGGWLGGVCAALAPVRGLSAGWLRAAFVAGALVGGAGIAL